MYKTTENFGIIPDVADHFCLFQKDLEGIGAKIGKINPAVYKHYNGLSQNWRLASEGGTPNYHLPEFTDYLIKSLKVTVPIHAEFMRVANNVITAFNARNEEIGRSPTIPHRRFRKIIGSKIKK